MSKHTPGPWIVADTIVVKSSIHDSSGYCLASVNIHNKSIQISEHEANARLIAAAPELLEAAQELITEYEKVGGKGTNSISLHVIDVMKKAIAKAEGK